MLSLLHLRRGRDEPAGEHHRLDFAVIPFSIPGRAHQQVGRLPLRLRSLASHLTTMNTYQANLKRELPRLPFLSGFLELSSKREDGWGRSMFPTRTNPNTTSTSIEAPSKPLDWRVEKMNLTKDKTCIRYNDFLTLAGIPPEALRTTAWAIAQPWTG